MICVGTLSIGIPRFKYGQVGHVELQASQAHVAALPTTLETLYEK